MFIEPKEKYEIFCPTIAQTITLEPNEYFLMQGGSRTIPVIRHNALMKIADNNGLKIVRTEQEYAVYHDSSSFCFVYRAYGELNGVMYDEVGEANPKNLANDIAQNHPATMAIKRAKDRVICSMLGIDGEAYSDAEIEFSREPEEVKEMTLEEAEQVVADFGQFKGHDITVKELQTIDPKSFEWLLNLPNPRGRMVKLNEAAKLIHNASAAE